MGGPTADTAKSVAILMRGAGQFVYQEALLVRLLPEKYITNSGRPFIGCSLRRCESWVVEDERRSPAELLQRGLTEEGHQVVVACDGATGFETACAAVFDVIVLDAMLPGIDGLIVARRLAG